MADGGHFENYIIHNLAHSDVWFMTYKVFWTKKLICAVSLIIWPTLGLQIQYGKEIIFDVSLMIRLRLDLQMQVYFSLKKGFANFGPTGLSVLWFGDILGQAIPICCHISLVVKPCFDTQIKRVTWGYLRKLYLNSFTSQAAPCHMSWWVHVAVCCFGPLNTLLHVYFYQTEWSPLVICIMSQIAKFMGPTLGPPGTCRRQMGPMLAPMNLAIRGICCKFTWSAIIYIPPHHSPSNAGTSTQFQLDIVYLLYKKHWK